MQPRRQEDVVGVLLLFIHVLCKVGQEAIPPVTLLIVLAQVTVYLKLFNMPWRGLSDACISIDTVIFRKQWLRILYGTVEHAHSLHLYFNMVSFLWKGMVLENMLGSGQFLYIVSLITVLCGGTQVGLNYLLGTFVDSSFYYHCTVGFSGVIFALKVLDNGYFPGQGRRVMGIDINLPSGYVVWLELVLMQVIVPNASFVGHLAGILVGLAYIHIIKPMADLAGKLLGQEPARFRRHGHVLGQRRRHAELETIPFGAILLSAALIALQTDVVPFEWRSAIRRHCMTSKLVFGHHQWRLLLLPALNTSEPLHLIYTVLSLLGLGYYLERKMGVVRFVVETVGLTVITNFALCLLTYYVFPNYREVAGVRGYETPYKCFLGLTATVIAMKGLYSAHYPRSQYLFLLFLVPVPKLIGPIIEIALLNFLFPYVWIVGNVIGFVAGLLLLLTSP
ncbi:uncharacterized protein LOC144179718 [Haemaphysalis longicornis]